MGVSGLTQQDENRMRIGAGRKCSDRLQRKSTMVRGPAPIMIALAIALLSGCSPARDPQTRAGLIVMAHGGDSAWNEAVEAAVQPLSLISPTEIAYGMADRHALQHSVEKLEARGVDRIAVVRLFVSGDSFLDQTEYFLGLRPDPPAAFLIHEHGGDMADAFASRNPQHAPRLVSSREHPIPPVQTDSDILLSKAGLYDSEQIGRIVVERVHALSRDPGRESVLVLAHGEGEDAVNQKWLHQLETLVSEIGGAVSGSLLSSLAQPMRDERIPV